MFTFCQRFVLMLECETFCARNLRFPVMSLLAMIYARLANARRAFLASARTAEPA
jgi:hypothetical protein